MIGFLKQPTGRLGNILLQYLFLREVADFNNSEYYYPLIKGNEYFVDLEETENYQHFRKKILGKKKYTGKSIRDAGIQAFNELVTNSNKIIVLEPPVLGLTFDTLYFNPNRYLRLRPEICKPYFEYEKYFVVALHFRGTDFAQWNPVACLDSEYYINAIKYCQKKFDGVPVIYSLFTDDLSINSYRKAVAYLENNNLLYHVGDPQRNLGEECYNISMSDVVISSPSTFAITASLIGKKKEIIHSKKWCEYCIAKNDHVWIQMLKNKCEFYQLECLL